MNKTNIAFMTIGIVAVLSVLIAGSFANPALADKDKDKDYKKIIIKCHKYDDEQKNHEDYDYHFEDGKYHFYCDIIDRDDHYHNDDKKHDDKKYD